MTYFLTLEDVTEFGIAMMAEEREEFLIADAGLLDSALMRPRASAFGQPAATKLFMLFNNVELRAPSADLGEQFVLDVIAGTLALPDIAQRLADWSTPA